MVSAHPSGLHPRHTYVYCRTSREIKGIMCDTRGLCSWPLQSLFSLGSSLPISEVGVSLFQYVVLPFPSLKCNLVRGWTRSSARAAQSLNFSISPADHSPKAFQLSHRPCSQCLNCWIPSSALARNYLNEVTQQMASGGDFHRILRALFSIVRLCKLYIPDSTAYCIENRNGNYCEAMKQATDAWLFSESFRNCLLWSCKPPAFSVKSQVLDMFNESSREPSTSLADLRTRVCLVVRWHFWTSVSEVQRLINGFSPAFCLTWISRLFIMGRSSIVIEWHSYWLWKQSLKLGPWLVYILT